jgi:hypothetical protein
MPRRTLELTAAERRALEAGRDRDPRPYFRERCAAVLKIADGWSARRVALDGLHKPRLPSTVRDWRDRYQQAGLSGLVQRPRGHGGFSPSAGARSGADRPPGAAPLRQ